MRLWPGHPPIDLELFKLATDELVSRAEAFFSSAAWSTTVRDNEVSHADLKLPRSIPSWRIREYADVIVTLGSKHSNFLEASRIFDQGDRALDLLPEKLDALVRVSAECLELFANLPVHPGLFLGERAEALGASLKLIVDETQRALQLATRETRAQGFTVPALPGFGLDDVGFIVVHWIARFRHTDPDLKVNIFALACAWDLLAIKNKERDTPSWASYERQFRRWSKHPYAAADIVSEDKPRNKNSMSGANS